MKMSNFYRLYVDGYRQDVLINTDNMSDALRLASGYIDDEPTCRVKVVYAHEKTIDLEEVKSCVVSFSEKGVL